MGHKKTNLRTHWIILKIVIIIIIIIIIIDFILSVNVFWNLVMLVFEERGKPEDPEKNLSEQRREPTTKSTHI